MQIKSSQTPELMRTFLGQEGWVGYVCVQYKALRSWDLQKQTSVLEMYGRETFRLGKRLETGGRPLLASADQAGPSLKKLCNFFLVDLLERQSLDFPIYAMGGWVNTS